MLFTSRLDPEHDRVPVRCSDNASFNSPNTRLFDSVRTVANILGRYPSGQHPVVCERFPRPVLPILRQRVVAAGKDGLLWPGSSENRKHKGKPAARMSVYLGFTRALKRLGLDERLRLHDLRHTYASHFVMAGGNIFELSRILGHHRVTITERTYAHLAPDGYEKNRNLVAFSMPAPKAGKVIAMKGRATAPAVTSRTR